MAIVTGRASKVFFNGVELGECSFVQTQPEESPGPAVATPNAVEVTVSMTLLPEAKPVIVDWVLCGRLGEHYKN